MKSAGEGAGQAETLERVRSHCQGTRDKIGDMWERKSEKLTLVDPCNSTWIIPESHSREQGTLASTACIRRAERQSERD